MCISAAVILERPTSAFCLTVKKHFHPVSKMAICTYSSHSGDAVSGQDLNMCSPLFPVITVNINSGSTKDDFY